MNQPSFAEWLKLRNITLTEKEGDPQTPSFEEWKKAKGITLTEKTEKTEKIEKTDAPPTAPQNQPMGEFARPDPWDIKGGGTVKYVGDVGKKFAGQAVDFVKKTAGAAVGAAPSIARGAVRLGEAALTRNPSFRPPTPGETFQPGAGAKKIASGAVSGAKAVLFDIPKGLIDRLAEFGSDPEAVLYDDPLGTAELLADIAFAATGVGAIYKKSALSAGRAITGKTYKDILGKVDDAAFELAGVDKVKLLSKIPDEWEVSVGRKFTKSKIDDQIRLLERQIIGTAHQPRLRGGVFDVDEELAKIGVQTKPGIGKVVSDTVHSPDVVMGKNPLSKLQYNYANKADLAGKMERQKWAEKAHNSLKGIATDSPLDSATFKLVDNGITTEGFMKMSSDDLLAMKRGESKVNLFTPQEVAEMVKSRDKTAKAVNFYKESFDGMLDMWAKEIVGEDAAKNLKALSDEIRANPKLKNTIFSQVRELGGEATQVLDTMVRREINYMPHLFDPKELKEILYQNKKNLTKQLATLTPETKEFREVTAKIAKIDESFNRLSTKNPILHDAIPRDIHFGPFDPRTGAPNYKESGRRAFDFYLNGIVRKAYDEPALKKMIELHGILPEDAKDYSLWFMRKFAGVGQGGGANRVIQAAKSFQWFRTLGINPRSAINNLTQRLNTLADVPMKWAAKGQVHAFSKEGRKLFESTGLAQTAGLKFLEGEAGGGALAKARDLGGILFRKAEEGNLRHGFSTGYLMGIKRGLSEKDAVDFGIRLAQKHHFRYGRIGTSKGMSGIGGLAFQFAGSYPVKQAEFLMKIAKENPAKLVKYWAISEGVKGTAGELFGIDLSNAVGFGVDYGSALAALKNTTDGDFRKARFNLNNVLTGGGFWPQGAGPLVSSIGEVLKGEELSIPEVASKLIEPVQIKRIRQGVKSIVKREGGTYPVFSGNTGARLYNDNLKEILLRTFLTTPSKESKEARETSLRMKMDKFGDRVLRDITNGLYSGDDKKIDKAIQLAQRTGLMPSDSGAVEAWKRENLTKKERQDVDTPPSRIAFYDYMKK